MTNSTTVYLADMSRKNEFNELWLEWIDTDESRWSQRVCIGANLATGLESRFPPLQYAKTQSGANTCRK